MSDELAVEQKPSLASAVLQVMGKIKRLEKGDKNTHGRYDFTSVDDFKDFVRPLLVEAGLSLHVTQTDFQMVPYTNGKEEKSVARFDFRITLHHAPSGEKSEPEDMTVALPLTGAQTSGAAKSYAIKEWMKARFLISSGDSQDEADLLEQSREGLRLSKAEARKLSGDLDKEFNETVNLRDYRLLAEWWQENKFRTETLPKDWFLHLRTRYAEEYKRLKADEELDKMSNSDLDQLALADEPDAVKHVSVG